MGILQIRLRRFWASAAHRAMLAVGLGTVLAIALTGFCSFGRVCAAVRGSTLRLHVLANSDSEADQRLKLQVRDALTVECAALFADASSLADAEATARAALPQLTRTAQQAVWAAGCSYPVTVSLQDMYFDTRTYDGYTLPAGQYRALRVVIGRGAGRNWWCVLFPPLCIPAAAEIPVDAAAVWGAEGQRLVTGDWQLRFALVEWLEQARATKTE